ncbi:hypothetical protein SCA6_012179 [Theobroma cacao]
MERLSTLKAITKIPGAPSIERRLRDDTGSLSSVTFGKEDRRPIFHWKFIVDQELCFGFGGFTGILKMRGKVVFLKLDFDR